MNAYEVIAELCKQRGIAITKLEKILGFGRGSIGKLRNGTTSAERLQKIADYFDVPLEYLMTGETYYFNEQTAHIAQEIFETPGMRVLFDAARNSKPEDLKMAADLLERLKETNPDG